MSENALEIKDDDDKDITYVAVEEDPTQTPAEEEEKKPPEGADDVDDDDGEDDEEEEQRLGAGEPEEDDAKRVRRREEQRDKRKRRKVARDRDRNELKFLRGRNETLERQFSKIESRVAATETSSIDSRITQIKGQIKLADQVMAKAVEAQKGDDFVEAQGIRDGLQDHLRELSQAKTQIEIQDEDDSQPQVDPVLKHYADDFVSNHSWWDPRGGDKDSRQVSAIDNGLIAEGYDPRTPEYWEELANRVQTKLPHRFESSETDDPTDEKKPGGKPKSPGPTFRSGGQERTLKPNEVYISPERKDALVEAGIWDDPERRNRYLKQYAQYDKDALANTGA